MAAYAIFEVKKYIVALRQLEERVVDGETIRIRAIVTCLGENYSMEIYFLTPDSYFPTPTYDDERDTGYMYMPIDDLPKVVDLLRNEKPIYAHARGDKPEWSGITTSAEPVGEGE